jgi:hypothetical protein
MSIDLCPRQQPLAYPWKSQVPGKSALPILVLLTLASSASAQTRDTVPAALLLGQVVEFAAWADTMYQGRPA